MRQVVEPAQLVRHGVDVAQRSIVEGHAGQKLRVGHVFPGAHVVTLGNGSAQVGRDQLHRLDCTGIGDRRCRRRHVGFDRVGQRVHTGGRGQALGHACHQRRIVDRQQWGDVTVDDGHFHVPHFVGNDAETGHFTRRAGGGIDRDQRHLWLGGLIHAFVITDVPAVGGAQGNALGTVMG
ncbi:hypothetical protein D3C86_1583230 [compost metagenome]